MMRRLVLGDRAVGSTVASHAAAQPGTLYVVTDDSGWVTTLRDAGVRAVEGDPTDATHYPDVVDTVVVAADDPERHSRIAMIASEVFPDATLLSVRHSAATESHDEQLVAVADRLVDPTTEMTTRLLEAAGPEVGDRMARLLATLRPLSKPLAVVTHDNPDPDAIASAIALTEIAEWVGVDSQAYYFGEITHQENRALLNLLSLPLQSMTTEEFSPDDYGAIALVDHARPGVNDSLPEATPVQIVVDHHPQRQPIDDRQGYLDIRPEVGSTSTIMVEYFRQLGLTPDEPLATALLYGIQTDTNQFTRGVSEADFTAAADLSAHADESALTRIESPNVSASVLDTLATAIEEREVRGSAAASCVGALSDRDALAQAAEELLNMAGIETVIVFGYADGTIYVSGRTRGSSVDLGETLREALGQVGSAGGHAKMAGAQVPMGILGTVEDWETLSVVVHDTIAERFFEALDTTPEPASHPDPLTRFPPE
ncbi:bifunctional oligoribonuclease/PAP phosphatase NrnA [Halonotius terrestris]|uniref:Bifunctional oligoribonuclease/PAP phosphatase NrnA n=1 Tax=Halonotius terrestris TaxID=2487750 RepID=A0A8J8TC55_9EURY|nr:bifunctional oligoribonuclease/PAP phosphatase NrnA [Halonotius terrestris]TQQ80858.1 bifunctional oligoribonuclease/PAP phosphatase NrnA [Halonotius terrestris]